MTHSAPFHEAGISEGDVGPPDFPTQYAWHEIDIVLIPEANSPLILVGKIINEIKNMKLMHCNILMNLQTMKLDARRIKKTEIIFPLYFFTS